MRWYAWAGLLSIVAATAAVQEDPSQVAGATSQIQSLDQVDEATSQIQILANAQLFGGRFPPGPVVRLISELQRALPKHPSGSVKLHLRDSHVAAIPPLDSLPLPFDRESRGYALFLLASDQIKKILPGEMPVNVPTEACETMSVSGVQLLEYAEAVIRNSEQTMMPSVNYVSNGRCAIGIFLWHKASKADVEVWKWILDLPSVKRKNRASSADVARPRRMIHKSNRYEGGYDQDVPAPVGRKRGRPKKPEDPEGGINAEAAGSPEHVSPPRYVPDLRMPVESYGGRPSAPSSGMYPPWVDRRVTTGDKPRKFGMEEAARKRLAFYSSSLGTKHDARVRIVAKGQQTTPSLPSTDLVPTSDLDQCMRDRAAFEEDEARWQACLRHF